MMSRYLTHKLVIATHNAGKLREMAQLLAPFGLETIAASALNLPEPEETGETFLANALIKARAASQFTGLPAFADDSGLCVAALDGAPGIYSARLAGQTKDFDGAMASIEADLQARGATTPDKRRAYFISALVIAWPDGHYEAFEGKIDGTLVWPPRGPSGFGYDPMFLPEGHTRTFGEMSAEEKHGLPDDDSLALSHRARAFQKLRHACLLEPEIQK